MLQALAFRENGLCKRNEIHRFYTAQRIHSVGTTKLRSFSGPHNEGINCVEVDRQSGLRLLVGGSKGSVLLYDLAHSSGTPKIEYPIQQRASSKNKHRFSVEDVQWYPFDSGLFVTGSADKELKIWDTETFSPVETYEFSGIVYSHHMPCCTYDHNIIAVATSSNQAKLIDLRTGSSSQILKGHKGRIHCIRWSNYVPYVVTTGSDDGHIYLWDIRMARGNLSSFDQHNGKKSGGSAHHGPVTALHHTEDGHHLVSYGGDNVARLWDFSTGRNMLINYGKIYNENKRNLKICVTSGAGEEVLFIPEGEIIRCFSLFDGELIKSLSGHFRQVNCCAFNPHTQEVYSGSNDRNLLVWSPDHVLEDRYLQYINEKPASKPQSATFTQSPVESQLVNRSNSAIHSATHPQVTVGESDMMITSHPEHRLSEVLADNWSDDDSE